MSVIKSVFDLVLGTFSTAWQVIHAVYSSFMAIFDSFASFFDSLFSNLGIYEVISDSLDTVTDLANQLQQYLGSDGLVSTISSFVAIDTLFTVVLTALSATVGVLLAALSFALVTVVPLLIGFLSVKGVLRLIRLCSGGIVKP